MKLDKQKAREEWASEEEEEVEKAQKEGKGRREVAVVVEIIKRSEECMVRPVTRDR